MAKTKENFKKMKIEELNQRLVDFKENIRALKFKIQGSKSKNVKEYASFKKQVARVLTEINSFERKTDKNNK